MKIYTKTGDEGMTSLVGGSRVSKGDKRIEIYGEIDELNSNLGLLRSFLEGASETHDVFLEKIQNELFDLGSNIACEKDKRKEFKLPQLDEGLVKNLEDEMDRLSSTLPALKNFILPAGGQASSQAHVCRVVCRRIEREMIRFEDLREGDLPPVTFAYMNRLSDYFFVLARKLNVESGTDEVLWSPSNS